MRIIARRTLREFWEKHRTAEQPLKSWFREASQASWKTPEDIKSRYRPASFLKGNRVVFNMGGNKYRLIVHANYNFGILYIRFVGTHAEYDRIDPEHIWMNIRPIRNSSDHESALKRIEALMSAQNGTAEGDELDVLATLVDAYEKEHFAIDSPPDPIEAIKFRMEQMGLSRKDLEPFLGSRARVSEVLNKRRGLSLTMIRSLHENLEIPLDALIGRES